MPALGLAFIATQDWSAGLRYAVPVCGTAMLLPILRVEESGLAVRGANKSENN